MLSPTPDSLSGGYAPSEPARPKSANRQHASGERSNSPDEVRYDAGDQVEHKGRTLRVAILEVPSRPLFDQRLHLYPAVADRPSAWSNGGRDRSRP